MVVMRLKWLVVVEALVVKGLGIGCCGDFLGGNVASW